MKLSKNNYKDYLLRKSLVLVSIIVLSLFVSCTTNSLITLSYESFDQAVTIEKGFKKYLDKLDALALKHSIIIIVQESIRRKDDKVTNAIVQPVQTSNHLVGHAIDINLNYKNILYNSSALEEIELLPKEIKDFIKECKNIGLRWGGDFIKADVVHFDDNLYDRDRRRYEKLYRRIQE